MQTQDFACSCCGYFAKHEKRRPFCQFTGEKVHADEHRPGCPGFHLRQHMPAGMKPQGGAWEARRV